MGSVVRPARLDRSRGMIHEVGNSNAVSLLNPGLFEYGFLLQWNRRLECDRFLQIVGAVNIAEGFYGDLYRLVLFAVGNACNHRLPGPEILCIEYNRNL